MAVRLDVQAEMKRIKETKQRILESSERSLALLRESEEIGVATAQKLHRQCEALERTNEHLDELKSNLKNCRKLFKCLQPGFNGLKNYFTDKSDHTRHQTSLRHRAGPSRNRLNDKTKLNIPSQITSGDKCKSYSATCLYDAGIQQITPDVNSQSLNGLLDANLNEMDLQILRLKTIGIALGDEIKKTSKLIDKVQDKVDAADIKIGKLNKQVDKHLLK